MHIITKWKGAPIRADQPCYSLKEQHEGGFFACVFSAFKNIIAIYNTTTLLPNNISIRGLSNYINSDDLHKYTEQEIFEIFFKKNDSINICANLFDLNLPENHKIPIAFASRPYSEIKFNQVFPFWNRFFAPSKEIWNAAENFITKYNINIKETLGVYYRGTDKKTEEQLPEYSDYIKKAKQMFQNGNYKKIIVQTDEEDCYKAFKTEFKDQAFRIEENLFSQTGNGVHKELRGTDQISSHSINMFATILLFSSLPSFLINTSHVSYAMVMYRGNLDNVIQYRRGNFLS